MAKENKADLQRANKYHKYVISYMMVKMLK